MLDNIREWISDNLRYILLGLAAIIVIIIAVVAIRAATHSGSSQNSKNSVVVQTEAETETESEQEIALVRNQPDVLDLATEYWTAIQDQDFDTLGDLCEKTFTDDDKSEIEAMDVAVESYDNIMTYSKPGLTDGSYVVYVYMDLKLTGIDTEAPTLREMYMETDDDGDLYVIQADDYSSDITAYTQLRQTDSDVQALIKDVNETLSERCEEDEDLAQYVESGSTDSSDSSDDEAVAGEDSADAEADADASGEDSDSGDTSDEASVGTATVVDGVNVRSSDSTDSDIISALYEGLSVNVIQDMGNGWLEISYVDESGNTVTGYVMSDYVSMN